MSTKTCEQQLQRVFSGQYEALNAPDTSAELGEVVLGTLENEKAKALYSVVEEIRNGAKMHMKDLAQRMEDADDKEERRKVFREIHRIKNQIEVMMNLFWEMVYEEYPQARGQELVVGIRKGWQVVIFKSQSPFAGLLGGMFG